MKRHAIAIKHLNVCATNIFGRPKTKILKNVSFNLPIGKICTFIGHNGAGKTTTIKSILGLRSITRGTIKIFNKPISDVSSKQILSYIPEKGNHEPIKAKNFLNDIGKFYNLSNKDVQERALQILKYFDIDKFLLNRKLNSLSTGQNKIIMFIQAFIADSKLIIADEPTDNLDPENRDLF
jgi:ABC-2 type transport system ATP-binding protein